jgi:predicted Zn-dependent protease
MGRLPLVIVLAVISVSLGCRSAPITGRKQLMAIPEPHEMSLGDTTYREILSEHPMSTDQAAIRMVNRVGQRIAAVADVPDYNWEFRVIAAADQNAFCLPGGKVGVYEGLLPLCRNEAELAVVLAHEVAHALARHGGERMSHQYAVNGVGNVVKYFSKSREEATQKRIHQAYGVASKYGVVLPYSRTHESEADSIGLTLMAKAGYDPSVAPGFWERFTNSPGPSPPEFFSTHPSDLKRAEELRDQLADAKVLYQQSPQKFGLGEPLQVARRFDAPSRSTDAANFGGASFGAAGFRDSEFNGGEFNRNGQQPRRDPFNPPSPTMIR